MTHVLFVISAADRWTLNDGSVHPSGYWAEEVAVPHRIFSEAGWDITIATPGGKAPTLDQLSLGLAGGAPWKRREVKRYLAGIETALATPVALDAVDADEFDLVFYPGGHGPMEDLAHDSTSGRLLANRLASGKPLALLCHAPAAILAATGSDGTSPFAGYRMTGLSNREELLNRFAKKAPWLLEDKLKEAGVVYSRGRIPLRPHVVVDRSLYTGQNPQSSERLARRLLVDISASS
ncbi:type 1 glutamine amidotransferase domain-containing protein [Saccharopolyspora sp. WRP15-2]|uniref:Type 1 glutamine amidotransferase domain-containing protein n=1 Tax=Saccharopolyspora oryzae TaxID=2997343 RepID=A0ABT4UQB5_9PSEU|nr:type 1 glutamine amidotransferase domain-containing protein [Saccharopolyspora oryzae]MDA3623918.1 type 1 glutamine amidotransferase domain-containing protein [Saccharopolyspora oryzae]